MVIILYNLQILPQIFTTNYKKDTKVYLNL